MKWLTIFLAVLWPLFGAFSLTQSHSEDGVAHLFTHCLAAYPAVAFAKNNSMRKAYDEDCLTPLEFKRALTSLHAKGFTLVDIKTLYNKSGAKRAPKLPAGKKPLVLSFDDVNYYVKKMNRGMNDKLIVSGGKIATYTENAPQKINFDNENITILENFVEKHPDFSFNGARAVICLTGFDGILGYRTFAGNPDREAETAGAAAVVSLLKQKNYRFACHGYGHYHMKKLSDRRFGEDTDKWLREVGSLVGETDIYAYPYGEWEITMDGKPSEKHKYLLSRGFRLFLGVGTDAYFASACGPGNGLLMDRSPVDGLSLRLFGRPYRRFFNCAEIYDRQNRFVPYPL